MAHFHRVLKVVSSASSDISSGLIALVVEEIIETRRDLSERRIEPNEEAVLIAVINAMCSVRWLALA